MSDAKDARIAELEAEVGQLKGELEAEKDKKRVVDYAEAVQYAEMKRRATTAEAERDALRAAVPKGEHATVVKHTVSGDVLAVFAYSDHARDWANYHYRNMHVCIPIARAAIAGEETA